ncbi:alpha/beta hydrolase family protein [Spongiimicrobium salis]|uniref:alpha/beta hydrolase family protein n=1 Tax=Spongiimicrobium salis TaxID=1667022 RepID=UPI00374D4C3D
MKTSFLLLVATCFLSCTPQKENTFQIGQKSITYTDESRSRPLVTEIWYPTLDTLKVQASSEGNKALFKPMATIPNASIPDQKFPLILVSHGTGGNRFSLTWLIERMVKKGYIVVSLDHYGNSTFNKIPREFVKWWERAIDVQFVLTNVLQDAEIGSKIDASRIGGVGHSLGGYTHIALAGGYVDRADRSDDAETNNERQLPPEFPEMDEEIDFDTDSLIVASYTKYKDLVKDERIKAFFVMAPAIGFGFHSKEQTKDISTPVYIVAGKGDRNTPPENNALKYHNLIATSTLHMFGENVGHYVFLNEATAFGKEVAPAITVDREGVDRKQIHDETVALALQFFDKNMQD